VAGYSRFVRGKCEVKGQLRLIESLKVMGYQSGITLQSVPYDWRPSLEDSDTGMRIVKAIRHVYNITGKKVVVVAHSMGGNHALHALAYFMDKS
jgi:pimeloyl-ACP methyl ester carboxylesterase